jgi:ribulose-5-phosphate 4-epimerase/fuculose-1-phosphate aldolase
LDYNEKWANTANDVRVVVHVHPTYCIAAMHAGIDLSTISNSFPELNRYTRVAPNVGDVAPISQELADAVSLVIWNWTQRAISNLILWVSKDMELWPLMSHHGVPMSILKD